MTNDAADLSTVLASVRAQSASGNIRVTRHALTEMISRGISLDELTQSIAVGEILENYPEHQRGPCCLVNGSTAAARPLHVVCTTAQPTLIIVTAYQPQLPKWKTPRQRNRPAGNPAQEFDP